MDEGLVHDGYETGSSVIVPGKVAACEELRPQSIEVAGRDRLKPDVSFVFRSSARTIYLDWLAPSTAGNWSALFTANLNDSGQRTKTRFNFLVHRQPFVGRHGGGFQNCGHEQNVVAIETQIQAHQVHQAPQKESRDR